MSKQTKAAAPKIEEVAVQSAVSDFTGVARSVVAYNNQGFKNYRIITLYLEQGRVVRQEHSDPYANFEAISRLELANEKSMLHLNNNWKSGDTLSL
jgi:hypothetical protein